MFSAFTSVANARKYLKRLVEKKHGKAKTSGTKCMLNLPNNSDIFDDGSFKSHSAPERRRNDTLNKPVKSHFSYLKAICDQGIGGAFFSSDIGNDIDASSESAISDDDTTDIDFYVNEYTRKNEESFDDFMHKTSLRRSVSAGPKFNTQVSTASGDSGICVDDARRQQRRNTSTTIEHELQKMSAISTTSIQTSKSEVVQKRRVSIVVSLKHETIQTTPTYKHNKTPKANIMRRLFSYSKQELSTPSPFQMSKKHEIPINKGKEECGKLKLSLQFFNDSQQLRVIVVRANKLQLHNCHIAAKVSLIGDNAITTKTTKATRVKDGDVPIKNEVYFNTASDVCDSRLKVQLYKVSTIFRRKTVYGQTILPLDDLDLNLDTSMWVSLFKPNGEDVWTSVDIDDILICTEDRSIQAETVANLFCPEEFDGNLTPKLPRAVSMTVNRRQSLSLRRRFNTMPLTK